MYLLSTPRGILAHDESKAVLEKIQETWPTEKTHITEWKAEGDRKHSSRRAKRAEDRA